MVATSPSETRRTSITRAAARLFNDHGFHNTSMDDIADAVGLAKPTVYHYVKSKAQIVSWIHDECVQAVLPPLRRYVREELAPSEIMYRVARDILSLLDNKPGYLRIYFENHRDLDRRSQTRIRKKRDEYYGLVKSVLERGNATGEFVIRDVTLTSMAFFGMCNWAYQWYRRGGGMPPEKLALYFWQHFLTGVLIDGAAGSADGLRPRGLAGKD